MIGMHNYELWFMDYLDGKLSPAQEALLRNFLREHPALAAELEEMSADVPSLVEDDIHFSPSLKKEITPIGHLSEATYEEAFIAHYEGDLDAMQQQELDAFLHRNPFLIPELEYIGKIIVPQTGEIFPSKSKLKKRPVIIPLYRYAAAASVLLLLSLGIIRYSNTVESVQTARALETKLPMPSVNLSQAPETSGGTSIVEHNKRNVAREKPQVAATATREPERTIDWKDEHVETLTRTDFTFSPVASSIRIEPISTPINDDTQSFAQIVGKVLENGVGKNDVSESLKKKRKITSTDVADLAAASFKNADVPLLSTSQDKASGKKRIKLSLGIFEADFALK